MRLVERADPALAALIANDTRTRRRCLLAGDRHLAVPTASGTAVRRPLREVGYPLALDNGAARKQADTSSGDGGGVQSGEA